MWPSDLTKLCNDLRHSTRLLRLAARECDSDSAEECAAEIESIAGSIVAAMEVDGIWAGRKIGHSDNVQYTDGDFSPERAR